LRLPAHALLACFLALATFQAVAGHQLEADPANYRKVLGSLQPGDTLRLVAGRYLRGLPLHHLQGAPGEPITITGPRGVDKALFLARSGHNTISIFNSSYLTIRNLVLDGANLPVDGVKAEGHADWAHHITLEGLTIINHGNNQQTVGISTKCPAWNWVVRDNVIIGAGTGMYFGNSDGSDAFVAGLIEHNLVINTIGYNLQVKHQPRREAVPGMPQGDEQTIIRHNVFSKLRGGSAGGMARPNVLVGHWPLKGPGQEDRYLIYGNFFYQNPNEALFQGEGNIGLYNNLFVNDYGDAIHIQPHNDIPRRIDIFFNTVLSAGAGIVVRPPRGDLEALASTYVQRVVANAVFASHPIEAAEVAGNVAAPLSRVWEYLRKPLAPLGQLDLRPSKSLITKYDSLPLQRYPDWKLDFNGTPRRKGEVGAYSAGRSVTDWVPRLERKP
jgi:hypothetical protein